MLLSSMFIWNVSPMTPTFSSPTSLTILSAISSFVIKYVSYRFHASNVRRILFFKAYSPASFSPSTAHFQAVSNGASASIFIFAVTCVLIDFAPIATEKSTHFFIYSTACFLITGSSETKSLSFVKIAQIELASILFSFKSLQISAVSN